MLRSRATSGAWARVAIVAAFLSAPLFLLSHSRDLAVGYTGAFGEPNCTACHTGTLNPDGGSVAIVAPVYYAPGGTFQVRVVIRDSAPGRVGWGFQLSARLSNGKQAGSFVAGGNVRVATAPLTGVQYASHQPAAVQAGSSYAFEVAWVAPPDVSAGNVSFDTAALSANGQGTGGDRVFTGNTVCAPSAEPRINKGGVVNAASYEGGGANGAAPGSLIAIFGQALSTETRLSGSFPLPVQLGGTTVTINGFRLPLIYVSPLQINAQVPFEVAPGQDVKVRVHGANRPDSLEESLRVEMFAPALFTLDSSGVGPAALLHADYQVVDAEHPARPGEAVLIYCTGLGQTLAPPLESGVPATGQRTLETPLVEIGGMNATVDFSGAAPGFAGLYQLNVYVPALPAGDHGVAVTVAGKKSKTGATIRVQP